MFTKTITATSLLASLALAQAGSGPIVAVPSAPIECQPLAVTFSGGTAPYFLSIIPGGQPSGTPLEFLPNQAAAGTYTWLVDIASGTSITIAIKDSTGAPNYSQQLTILAGTTTACLGKSNPGGAAAAGGSNSSAPAGASSSAGAGTTRSNATSAAVPGSQTTSAPATSSTSAASTGVVANGTAVVGGDASSLLSKVSSAVSASSSSSAAAATASAKSGASTVQLSGVTAFFAAIFALVV